MKLKVKLNKAHKNQVPHRETQLQQCQYDYTDQEKLDQMLRQNDLVGHIIREQESLQGYSTAD